MCFISLPFIYLSPFTHCNLASAAISPLIIFWLKQGIELEQKEECHRMSQFKN